MSTYFREGDLGTNAPFPTSAVTVSGNSMPVARATFSFDPGQFLVIATVVVYESDANLALRLGVNYYDGDDPEQELVVAVDEVEVEPGRQVVTLMGSLDWNLPIIWTDHGGGLRRNNTPRLTVSASCSEEATATVSARMVFLKVNEIRPSGE